MSASDSGKIILENEKLRVALHPFGAELQSFYSKALDIELLWQAGPEWPKHSPVLFPIVGALKENRVIHNKELISLTRHGFARDSLFAIDSDSVNHVRFRLCENESTLKVYPFRFEFFVEYILEAEFLTVKMEVINTGDDDLYCSYGAHPAFRIPLFDDESFSDYILKFEPKKDSLSRYPLKNNLIANDPEIIELRNGELNLSRSLFAKDALVFKDSPFDAVKLMHRQNGKGIRMYCENWPYFGIWTTGNAPFLCLEPWQGIADTELSTGILNEKEGILKVSPGKHHSTSYKLEVLS